MTYPSSDDQSNASSYESSAPAYSAEQNTMPSGEDPGQTFGILAIVFAFVFSPLAIVFGYLSRKKSRESGRADNTLGKVGFILGIVFVVIGIVFGIGGMILGGIAAGMSSV